MLELGDRELVWGACNHESNSNGGEEHFLNKAQGP